jgi:RNA polymerase sigma factor (sigma-70 family)
VIVSAISDKDLIAGCLQGDVKSQRSLYERFSPKMYAVCLRYAKEPQAAQDILQDAFVKVFRSLGRFRADGSFEGWIRRIVVNTCIEAYRKQLTLYAVQDYESVQVSIPDNGALDQLNEQDILRMISTLSPGYRTIFNLFVIEGYSHKEIAEQLQISEGTSKSQLARARYLLQEMITGKIQQQNTEQKQQSE